MKVKIFAGTYCDLDEDDEHGHFMIDFLLKKYWDVEIQLSIEGEVTCAVYHFDEGCVTDLNGYYKRFSVEGGKNVRYTVDIPDYYYNKMIAVLDKRDANMDKFLGAVDMHYLIGIIKEQIYED